MTETKQAICRMEVKAVNPDARTFEGLAATYDLDLQGDVIEPGAFKRSLRQWKRSGDILPLQDSHNVWSIYDTVGKLVDAEERDGEGLWTKWRVVPGARGDEVLSLLSDENGGPFIDRMSIGYRPVKWEMTEDPASQEEIRLLKEIQLDEVSLVRFPANPMARTDPGTVTKRVQEALDVLVDNAPEGARAGIKAALEGAIAKCGGAHCRSTKQDDDDDVVPPARRQQAKRAPRAPQPDPEEPDLSLLSGLKLRQLETRPFTRGVSDHG